MDIEIRIDEMNFLLMGSFVWLIDKTNCLKFHILFAPFLLDMFRANLRFVNATNNKDKMFNYLFRNYFKQHVFSCV